VADLNPLLDEIDLVVFDKDGTLISFGAMWSSWARELGARLEIATRRPVAGDIFATIGYDPSTDRVQPGGPLALATVEELQELVAAVLRRWCPNVAAARRILAEAWFEPDPVERASPLAELGRLFAALRSSGRSIAVATLDHRDSTESTLDAFDLADQVGAIACGDDPGPAKPDPEVLVRLAAVIGVPLERTAMIGDTPADLAMARAAGVGRTIGVASGIGQRDELEPLADVVLGTVGELLVGEP
jgi:phosphoglycolate phosphatase-like HAD superfamily hydrolase